MKTNGTRTILIRSLLFVLLLIYFLVLYSQPVINKNNGRIPTPAQIHSFKKSTHAHPDFIVPDLIPFKGSQTKATHSPDQEHGAPGHFEIVISPRLQKKLSELSRLAGIDGYYCMTGPAKKRRMTTGPA